MKPGEPMQTDEAYDDYYDAAKKDGEVIQGRNGGQIEPVAHDPKLPAAAEVLVSDLTKIRDKCRPGYMVSKFVVGWITDSLAIAKTIQCALGGAGQSPTVPNAELLSIVRRWAALDGGAWHVERYAREKAELLEATNAAIDAALRSTLPQTTGGKGS